MSRQHRISQIRAKAKAKAETVAEVIPVGKIVPVDGDLGEKSYKELQEMAKTKGLKSVGISKADLIESLK